MRVQHLVVDEINVEADASGATVTSTHFDFQERRWVSPHQGVGGQKLGPLTLVGSDRKRMDTPTVGMELLGERPLPVKSGKGLISFETTWTIEPESVYAVVLPQDHVAQDVGLRRYETDGPALRQAVTDEDRLFFHTIFMSPDVFEVEMVLKADADGAYRQALRTDVVNGRDAFQQLRAGVEREALRPDFWMRLLEMGHQWLP